MQDSQLPATAGANPYPGPRPFELGERIYGREREIAELYYRLSAQRIVLLHSPSGAGKSSLVYAGLIPRLLEHFSVWRPTRVNLEWADGVETEGVNRYVRSAILGFEQGLPEDERRTEDQIAGLPLSEYCAKRPPRPGAPDNKVLIFDQFEEILTVDPLNIEAKVEFFDQLGALLRDESIWALVIIREDYLAALDPYRQQVPTHLQNRYRIDLLKQEAAKEAIEGPAELTPRKYSPGVVDSMVRDLATIQVQQPDGSFDKQQGPNVEPLQLQVVCSGLWDRMPQDDLSVDPEDVEAFGNVSDALSNYYAESVAKAADGDIANERAIREWFNDKLITAGGIRSQVLREETHSGELDNNLIAALRNSHLLRAERRGGATWFELSHDRLVEPVRQNNDRWFDEHLGALQRQASIWDKQQRPESLLFSGQDLAIASDWAENNPSLCTDVDREFMSESRHKQAAIERERRFQRAIAAIAVVALVLGVFAAIQWKSAIDAKEDAVNQKEAALEAEKTAEDHA